MGGGGGRFSQPHGPTEVTAAAGPHRGPPHGTDRHRDVRTHGHHTGHTDTPPPQPPRPALRGGEEEGRALTSSVHGADSHRHLHFGVPHRAPPRPLGPPFGPSSVFVCGGTRSGGGGGGGGAGRSAEPGEPG